MPNKINTPSLNIPFSRYIQNIKSILLVTILLICTSFLCGNDIAQADVFRCVNGINKLDQTGKVIDYVCQDDNTNPVLVPGLPKPSDLSDSSVQLSKSDSYKCKQNEDWSTNVKDNGKNITVLSIHGGQIEEETSVISQKLHDLYNWICIYYVAR